MHIHHKYTSKGVFWKSCFYFVLLFTVHPWFCWFKQCGEMLQCPYVVAEWAVKPRGRALWLAGSSLPYINNNSYNNKIKMVTKCYQMGTDSPGDRRLQESCTRMRLFKGSVWLQLSSPSLILQLFHHLINYSFTLRTQNHTQYTHSQLSMRTNMYIYTSPHREWPRQKPEPSGWRSLSDETAQKSDIFLK